MLDQEFLGQVEANPFDYDDERWRSPHSRVALDKAGNSFVHCGILTSFLNTVIMTESVIMNDFAKISADTVRYGLMTLGVVGLLKIGDAIKNIPAADDLLDNGGNL